MEYCPQKCHSPLMDHNIMVPIYSKDHYSAELCSTVPVLMESLLMNGDSGREISFNFCGLLGLALGCTAQMYCTLQYCTFLFNSPGVVPIMIRPVCSVHLG